MSSFLWKKIWSRSKRSKQVNHVNTKSLNESNIYDDDNDDDDNKEKESEMIDFEIDESYLDNHNKDNDNDINNNDDDIDIEDNENINDDDDDDNDDNDTLSAIKEKSWSNKTPFFRSSSYNKDTKDIESDIGSTTGDVLSTQDNVHFICRDNNLIAIGKQISALETACKNDEEKEQQEFNEDVVRQLNIQVKELQNICESYRNQIEADKDKGINHIRALERELLIHMRSLEIKKKKKYFPFSHITIGQNGIYAAVNELWVENISGNFSLEVVPGQGQENNPTLKLNLAVTLHIQATGFKLFGEKGKNLPRLSFDKLKVRLSVNFEIIMRYDVVKTTWFSDVFHFKVLSFKGPYGLTKSLVSTLLSLFKSQIKKGILDSFPLELGELLKGLPSNLNLSGEFDINGMSLKELSTNIYKSPTFVELTGHLPSKLKYFRWLQQSMEKSKPIASVWDLIYYSRLLIKHPRHADSIIHLWNRAIAIYNENLAKSVGNICEINQHCDFNDFLSSCDVLWRKKVAVTLKVVEVDGQISLNSILRYGHQFLHRIAQQESTRSMKKSDDEASSSSLSSSKNHFLNSLFRMKSGTKQKQSVKIDDSPKRSPLDSKKGVVREGQLLVMLDKIQSKYESAQNFLRSIVNNLDFANSKIIGRIRSGPDGILVLNIHDFLLQVPLALHIGLAKSMNLTHQPFIPTAVLMLAENNDDVRIEVYHEIPGRDELKKEKSNHEERVESTEDVSASKNDSICTNRITVGDFQEVDDYDYDDYDDEDLADRFLVSSTSISEQSIELLAETSTTFKSGSQIFSLSLCNKNAVDKRPQRQHSDDEDHDDDQRRQEILSETNNNHSPPTHRLSAQRRVSAIQTLGIRIKTAPTVKCLVQVQKIDTTCSLTNLLRYISAHVEDTDAFQQYIMNSFGCKFEDEINLLKFFLETFSKYFLHPGLDVSINLDGKILSLENQIFIRVETLQGFLQEQDNETFSRLTENVFRFTKVNERETNSTAPISLSADSNNNNNNNKSKLLTESCALSVNADVNILDLYEDYLAISNAFNNLADS